jgi:hypothetical protein
MTARQTAERRAAEEKQRAEEMERQRVQEEKDKAGEAQSATGEDPMEVEERNATREWEQAEGLLVMREGDQKAAEAARTEAARLVDVAENHGTEEERASAAADRESAEKRWQECENATDKAREWLKMARLRRGEATSKGVKRPRRVAGLAGEEGQLAPIFGRAARGTGGEAPKDA